MDKKEDERIIKQGPVKHKDTTMRFSLERWKPRIAVLKSLKAGKLQFVLVDNKGVEKYQVPIEDYAGIWINPKPDGNEKYSFALITERATDVFSFETEEAMKRWGDVIQEKLGRVLIVNITIPYRQHQLKQGLAMLILRDNAITITTKEQPPKFQCGILIRHIKHYGDFDDGFVFETGNKCPKGENTFLIRCANNKKLYNLLDSLANRSTTVQDIVLRHGFSEIASPQGPLPKVPLVPKIHSPSFNFGNLSSQFKQNRHEHLNRKLRSVSDIPQSHNGHRPLTTSDSSLPYYNMEPGQENYQNLGRDGQSIVPEVEYEIIPDDPHNDVFTESSRRIKPKRGSVPVHSNYHNLQMDSTKSATMQNPSKSQRDSEYINTYVPPVIESDNYVNTSPVSQEPAGDSYANFKPISLSTTKHSEGSPTEYVNFNFTESRREHKPSTSDGEILPVGSTLKEDGASFQDPDGSLGNVASNGHDEADEITSIPPCEPGPKFLPADGEYENVVPSPAASGYVMLSTVSVNQVTQPTTAATTKSGAYKEIVSIKTPPSTTTATPPPMTVSVPASEYEDFVPAKTSAGNSLPSEVTTVDTEPATTMAYKEFVSIKTPTGDNPPPLETTNDPATGYEDFVPIKAPSVANSSEITDQPTMVEYEDFVPIKTPTADNSLLSDEPDGLQCPQTAPGAAYNEFVPIKTPSSTTPSSTTPHTSEVTNERVSGYEDFVPSKPSPSTHASNSQRHLTVNETDKEYSRLQFNSKENPTMSEQSDSATYSTLVHAASTGSSNSDSFYSKLDTSEASKTGHYDHIARKDKPLVPSRSLKKPMKLYEQSSNVVTVVPPLPPRNRTSQYEADSPSPPAAGPKPVVLPKSVTPPVTPTIGPKPVTPPVTPTIGPKPVTRSSELKYCDLEFADIGQPKFRPRSKQLTDPAPSSHHDAYAVIDRDASIGLQLALKQKEQDRR